MKKKSIKKTGNSPKQKNAKDDQYKLCLDEICSRSVPIKQSDLDDFFDRFAWI